MHSAMHLTFSGTLTDTDVKRHIPHQFDLPEKYNRLAIRLRFEPLAVGDIRNLLALTIFDPNGFRGAGHRGGNDHLVVIDADGATPGYAPGPLPAGQWIVEIDTHMILPGEPCRYELTVDAEIGPPTSAEVQGTIPPKFDFIANPNPGWYRGDLHSHTIHSDARWDVPDLVAAARAKGLDFVTLTDHNTVCGLAEIERYSTDGFLTMGGQELTTFWGHAICLGAHEWLDWRVTQDGDEMISIAERLYADGNIFIIAHPKDVGDPYCTGCRWLYPNLAPGQARFVEVWNEAWRSGHAQIDYKNTDGLALWYEWLNAGFRLVATAGSDVHESAGYAEAPGFNVIYAEELSRDGLFSGLVQGHLYLSSGPSLNFEAWETESSKAMMGDTLMVSSATASVSLNAGWAEAPADARVRLLADGEVLEELTIDTTGELHWMISTQAIDWCLIEMRDTNDDMLALTNPIFFNSSQRADAEKTTQRREGAER